MISTEGQTFAEIQPHRFRTLVDAKLKEYYAAREAAWRRRIAAIQNARQRLREMLWFLPIPEKTWEAAEDEAKRGWTTKGMFYFSEVERLLELDALAQSKVTGPLLVSAKDMQLLTEPADRNRVRHKIPEDG